ncbi:unnamed protein product, partial [marine sediment metagenome]
PIWLKSKVKPLNTPGGAALSALMLAAFPVMGAILTNSSDTAHPTPPLNPHLDAVYSV